MKKYFAALIALVLIGIGGFWLYRQSSLSNQAKTNFQGTVKSLTIDVSTAVPELSSLLYIAAEKGYFKDQGLRVTLQPVENGNIAIANVLAGKTNLGLAPEFAIVSEYFKHPEIKIISSIGRAETVDLIARQVAGITSPKDVKGKKIGVPFKSSLEFFLGRHLALHDITATDIERHDTPFAQLQPRIASGELDAVAANDPFAYQIKQALGDQVVSWPIQENLPLSWLLFGRNDFLVGNRPSLERLLQAILQAESYLQSNPTEAKALVRSYLKSDPAYFEQAWQKHEFSVGLDQSLIISMEDQARWRIENNLTDAAAVPNYLDAFHFQILDAVKPESVSIIH